jgi:hypothetical protein
LPIRFGFDLKRQSPVRPSKLDPQNSVFQQNREKSRRENPDKTLVESADLILPGNLWDMGQRLVPQDMTRIVNVPRARELMRRPAEEGPIRWKLRMIPIPVKIGAAGGWSLAGEKAGFCPPLRRRI